MSAVDELCRSYLDVCWHFDPAAASAAGRKEQDARLGRFDAVTVREHLAAVRALAGATEELDVDDQGDEIDRTALLDDMRVLAFRFDNEQPHVRNPAFWLAHLDEAFSALLLRQNADGAAAGVIADRLREVPPFLEAAISTLARPASIFNDAALARLGGTGELIVAAVQHSAALAPDLEADLALAARDALAALKAFGTSLTQVAPDADPLAFAAGEDEFEKRLRFEHALLAGAPELCRYGLRLRDELEAQVTALAHRINPSLPWRDQALRLADEESPDPSALVATYADEVAGAAEFVAGHGAVTLPDVPVETAETPTWLRSLTGAASYRPAPRYLPDETSRLFINPGVSEHGAHLLGPQVAHQAWPGRHLMSSRAAASGSEVRRHIMSRLTFDGWALYAEDLMAEEGFFRSLESRLLHLVRLLGHAVAIDIDVGLHTRGVTPVAAIDELVARLPIERRAAEAWVRRICQEPAMALCAAVGRRELLSLRQAVEAERGAGFTLRGFHDEVLAYGGLPLSLIRWGMGAG